MLSFIQSLVGFETQLGRGPNNNCLFSFFFCFALKRVRNMCTVLKEAKSITLLEAKKMRHLCIRYSKRFAFESISLKIKRAGNIILWAGSFFDMYLLLL